MLEGLEISVLKLSEVLVDNLDFRTDSEYFSKKYLDFDLFLRNKKSEIISKYARVSDGDHSKFPENQREEVRYLQAKDIKNHFIEDNNPVYISREYFNKNKRSHVTEENVILSIMGSVGDIAITPKDFVPTLANRAVAIIKEINELNPYYLFAYLSSKYGQLQIDRQKNGGVQVRINLDVLSKVKIPFVKNEFQKEIEYLVRSSHEKRNEAKQTYYKAEKILLQEIGLQDFESSKEPVNIKSFKESFITTKRLDAEYYQKKYEQLVSIIEVQRHDVLNNIVDITKSIEPGSNHYSEEEGLPFYRVSDYNKFGLSKPDKELTNAFVADNKDLIEKLKPRKGTILFSKDASVGTAYLLREDLDGITSGAILHLKVKNSKEILPEYLTLALNSKLVQMQAERDAGGSIILHWRKEEIEQVVVPIIDFKKQEQIAELVEESFKLKSESERLLEVAKKAVEMAIETDEKTGINYLEKIKNGE